MTITAWLTAAIIAAQAAHAQASDPTRPRVVAAHATLALEQANAAAHPAQNAVAQAYAQQAKEEGRERRMARWRAISEPAAWATMLLGLAVVGALLRRRRSRSVR
jgi:MYXO-CTERM domain-containing protein